MSAISNPNPAAKKAPQKKDTRALARSVSLSAVLAALALIFSYIEMLVPFNFGVPGIKLGLSNLVVLIALYGLGASYAFSVNVTRIVLAALLFGGFSAMLYSLAGGLLSFAVMVLLKKMKVFSVIGVSLGGGVFHNVGQLTVAALVTSTSRIFYYMPILLISGMVTGVILGAAAAMILKRLQLAHV